VAGIGILITGDREGVLDRRSWLGKFTTKKHGCLYCLISKMLKIPFHPFPLAEFQAE